MTAAGLIGFALAAFIAWRIDVNNRRRLRRARARLEAMHAQHDERAARAALRPHTGDVTASAIHPPTFNNGKG